MFVFQQIQNERAIETTERKRSSALSRTLSEEHVYPTSFETAYHKLGTAQRVQESIYGLLDYVSGISKKEREAGEKYWSNDCLKVLEDMGYEDAKQAFRSFELSIFEGNLDKGRAAVDALKRIYDSTQNEALRKDLATAANSTASIFLAVNSKYISWAANDWALRKDSHMETFFELVDANTYLAHTNISNLYSAGGNVGGKIELAAEPNSSLNSAYYAILPSSLGIDFASQNYPQLVSDYSEKIGKLNEAYEKYSNAAFSSFARRQRIAVAASWHEKLYLASQPYAEAAIPVFMAVSMMDPLTAPAGYAYFANDAKNAFKEGRNLEGSLITLTLSAPLFRFMRGMGGIADQIGAFGSGASHAAGTVFQIQIGLSTIPLVIDGAKYGMGEREIAQLGQNVGFLAMPISKKIGVNRLFGKIVRQPVPKPPRMPVFELMEMRRRFGMGPAPEGPTHEIVPLGPNNSQDNFNLQGARVFVEQFYGKSKNNAVQTKPIVKRVYGKIADKSSLMLRQYGKLAKPRPLNDREFSMFQSALSLFTPEYLGYELQKRMQLSPPLMSASYAYPWYGLYWTKTNLLNIVRGTNIFNPTISTMAHELHHYLSDIGGGGRSHVAQPEIFPKGYLKWLSEGITQLYTLRLYNSSKYSFVSPVYPIETSAAVLLEKLAGAEALRQGYFFGNWSGVYNALDGRFGMGFAKKLFSMKSRELAVVKLTNAAIKAGINVHHPTTYEIY